MLGTGAHHTPRGYFAAFIDIAAQTVDILVIDVYNLVSAKVTDFAAWPPAAWAWSSFSSIL